MEREEHILLFETTDFSSSTMWRFWLDSTTEEFFIANKPTIQQFDKNDVPAVARTVITRDNVQVQALINQTHITDKQRNVLRHLGFYVCRDIRVISHKQTQYSPVVGLFYWFNYEVIVKKQYELVTKRFDTTVDGQSKLAKFLVNEARLALRRQSQKVKA